MERHLLVTLSENRKVRQGVRFVGHFFSNKQDLRVTLFYTAPRPPSVWEGEGAVESAFQAEQAAKKAEAVGRRALADAERELILSGFAPEAVETRLEVRKVSKATDIVQAAAKGLYDALVLGRRGISRLEESFDESVSRGVLAQKVNFPLWICRSIDSDRKGVLACLDGSEQSYRMVDHVGFMLASEPKHPVTLFVGTGRGGSLQASPEAVMAEGRAHLQKHGVPEERIQEKVVEGGKIPKTILTEIAAGGYAAVAVGRTGADRGLLEKIFMGSVSTRLFQEVEGAAVWICQ